jgi:nucleotide-binding universal stress UspA family protein
MSKNLYIVPYDFSPVGDAAVNYAFHLGVKVKAEIQLIHLVASKADAIKASHKLEDAKSRFNIPEGVVLTTLIREGSIFEDIGKIAAKEGAQLIVMGTHGSSGLQKLFGSNAMKVITSSQIPFLIVQKETLQKDIKNIVVPIDLTKESLQIVNIAGDVASIFGATVHVIGEKQNDELLSQQMKNRILIVKNQYDDRKINCSVEFMKSGGSYQKKIMNFASEKSIDLIAIAYHSESLLPQFDTFAQSLITNDQKLPCMVLNSKLASALYF